MDSLWGLQGRAKGKSLEWVLRTAASSSLQALVHLLLTEEFYPDKLLFILKAPSATTPFWSPSHTAHPSQHLQSCGFTHLFHFHHYLVKYIQFPGRRNFWRFSSKSGPNRPSFLRTQGRLSGESPESSSAPPKLQNQVDLEAHSKARSSLGSPEVFLNRTAEFLSGSSNGASPGMG